MVRKTWILSVDNAYFWRMMKVILMPFLLLWICLPGYANDQEESDRIFVMMRKIGHEVLLTSGDATSWILPIERVNETTFLVRFEKPFAFTPDSLVKIIHRHLVKGQLPLDYLVEVYDWKNKKVAYSYEVVQSLDSSIHCLQRKPPVGFYEIKIHFAQVPVRASSLAGTTKLVWLLIPAFLLGLAWKLKLFSRKPIPAIATETGAESTLVNLGQLTFCLQKQILRLGNERIELSAKESKLLKIFASAPNEVIDRDQLMKLVWEDEGVFVGRSLDVFVSRLRKKLQPATLVRLVNIHGRGYKLEVDLPNGQAKSA